MRLLNFCRVASLAAAIFLSACSSATVPGAPRRAPAMALHESGTLTGPGGLRITYRTDGSTSRGPRPTIFVVSTSGDALLYGGFELSIADLLVPQGWLAVSIDLPAHGLDRRRRDPADLPPLIAWRRRIEGGENIVAAFTKRLRAATDYLIKAGVADPGRLAVAGNSRGGFMAMHGAAADPRIRAVAAFMPVTDLLALEEFRGMEQNALTARLHIGNQARALAATPLWITIGTDDTRVSTAACVAFAGRVKAEGGSVALHVVEAAAHSVPDSAFGDAAAWLAERIR